MIETTLEITDDETAAFVRDGHRYEIRGSMAAVIISAYRHLLTHPETGNADAALYLWGAIDGMRYSLLEDAKRTMLEIEQRRLDRSIPPDFTSQRS